MEPFIRHTGIVAPVDRVNVDTDAIVPKQFLKRIERSGFGQFLFFDWRQREDGTLDPDFELNRPEYRSASVLVVRRNFGASTRAAVPPPVTGHAGAGAASRCDGARQRRTRSTLRRRASRVTVATGRTTHRRGRPR